MIEIGKLNTLTVVRKSDLGYMLTDGVDEILMHFKESKKELNDNDFGMYKHIGVMAGASTPRKSIEEVIEYLEEIK